MRLVLGDRQIGEDQDSRIRLSTKYVELEFPLSDKVSMTIYVLPRSEHSAFVGTCWGQGQSR